MKRSLGGSRNANLSRPSTCGCRPARRNFLRSFCAAGAAHAHKHRVLQRTFAAAEKHVSTCFLARDESLPLAVAPKLKTVAIAALAPPRHPAGQENPCARFLDHGRRENSFRRGGQIGGNDRRSHGLGLDGDVAESSRLGCWHDNDRGGEKCSGHIAMAGADR